MNTASQSRRMAKVLARPALWFCACNLLAAALAAQCSNPTQVSSGTYTSGDHSATDNNALSAATVVLSGGASATYVAGNCIQLLPGFHATAGSAATTFHAWVEAVPTAVSVSPSSGSGVSQAFTWTASSPSGAGNIASLQLLFNSTFAGSNACWVNYNAASNTLTLASNAGTTWSIAIVAGQAGSVSNSQCTVNGIGSSVSASGNQLALTVSITFQTAFAGTKNNYMEAYDNEGLYTGWQQMGTWTVGSSQQYYLTTGVGSSGGGTVSPGSGYYNSGSYVTITATPASGYQFNGFTGSVNSGSNPLTVTMNSTVTETANFTQTSQYYLMTSAGSGGSVSPASGYHTAGSQVAITATPASGYQFTGFTGSVTSASDPLTVTMNSAITETASFALTPAITPGSVVVPAGQAQQFQANVAVTWSVTSGPGSISSSGLYTAPANASSGTAITVSGAASGGSASAQISIGVPALSSVALLAACVGSSGTARSCILAPGNYTVTQPIIVGRSVVIGGSGDPSHPTVLGRGQNFICPIITVGDTAASPPPSGLCTFAWQSYTLQSPSPANTAPLTYPGTTAYQNITIQNLIVCGGGLLNANSSNRCYQDGYETTETTCGSWTNQVSMWFADKREYPNSNPNNRPDSAPGFDQCYDIKITDADTGLYSPTPWDTSTPGGAPNSTSYAVTISNVDMEDSTGHAIAIYPNPTPPSVGGGSQTVNGVHITNNSAVNGSAITAVLLGTNGDIVGAPPSINWRDYTQCDNWPRTFADDQTLGIPRNIIIDNSSFANNNTGFMGGLARYVGIRNNIFTNNYINPQVGNYGGGTLELDQCSDPVQITGNTMTGPPPQAFSTSGLELYSRNLYVNGNTISGYPDNGIGAFSFYNATITGNHVYNNNNRVSNFPQGYGDIWVATSAFDPCNANRNVLGLNIQGNDSVSNGVQQAPSNDHYGIMFPGGGEGTTNVLDLLNNGSFSSGAVSTNSFAYLNSPFFWDERVNILQPGLLSPPASATASSGPQTITVFPECTQPRGYPLGTNDPGAGASAPTSRRFFRFAANDPLGPGNVTVLQGFLGTAPGQPPGPTISSGAYQCHFAYYPATQTLWLDGPASDFSWTGGSSSVGAGGVTLTSTNTCSIYAATSSLANGPENLVLILDIKLLQTGTWYMFETVQDPQGNYTNVNGGNSPWAYWGYWPVTSIQ